MDEKQRLDCLERENADLSVRVSVLEKIIEQQQKTLDRMIQRFILKVTDVEL